MVTSQQCLAKYGPASEHNEHLMVWDVPALLAVGRIPKKIFCNRDLIGPLAIAFHHLIERGFVKELNTWDGCFNIRMKRNANTMSLHSWGIAVDVNAATNALNQAPTLSEAFVKCFTDAGFDWGGHWHHPIDGMHFQLTRV